MKFFSVLKTTALILSFLLVIFARQTNAQLAQTQVPVTDPVAITQSGEDNATSTTSPTLPGGIPSLPTFGDPETILPINGVTEVLTVEEKTALSPNFTDAEIVVLENLLKTSANVSLVAEKLVSRNSQLLDKMTALDQKNQSSSGFAPDTPKTNSQIEELKTNLNAIKAKVEALKLNLSFDKALTKTSLNTELTTYKTEVAAIKKDFTDLKTKSLSVLNSL